MKNLLLFGCVLGLSATTQAETGVWTLKRTSDLYSPYETASNWKDSYIPNQSHDSAEFTAVVDHTNDRSWIYGNTGTGAIFGNVTLPAANGEANELVLDDLSGYRQYRLRSSGGDTDCYSFLNMSRYLGSIELRKHTRLRVRAAESGSTQELHKLVVSGVPTLDVDGGVVELGGLAGVGTLTKTGTGELSFSGVTSANGVRVKVAEGVLKLKGVPTNPVPVSGAAAHFDFSDVNTLTMDTNGRVSKATDVRGGAESGYRSLTPTFGGEGNRIRRQSYGDLQLLDFGDGNGVGYHSSLICDAKIPSVKTLFVVYRHNVQDFNGAKAFPVNSEQGYELRRPEVQNEAKNDKDGCCAMLWDFSAFNLFMYQQYGHGYQCFAPHTIVTGDIRRNGESVVYNQTPRSFRDELEVLSINLNTNCYTGGAISDWNFKYVARAQNNGHDGGCQIGEILVYTNALTDAEQKQNLDYLMAKWGRAESKRPWIASAVGGSRTAEIHVPAGETAYVKAIDTRSGPVIKTGAGTLAARYVDGSGSIRVKEGQVAFLPGQAPTESGAGDFKPAPGMCAHFDAADADLMTFDADGKSVLRWNSSVTNRYAAYYNDYLAVTNKSCETPVGMVPFVTEADGKKWVDFGEIAYTPEGTAAPNAGCLRVGRPDTQVDNSSDHVREIFWVWRTRPATDGRNPSLISSGSGTSNNKYWRYVRPGVGVMIDAVSAYSDGNKAVFESFRNAQWAVDGRVVDPTLENYPTDVHVVRVSLPVQSYFCGIGNDYANVRGGFQLGELITYYRELTDRERIDTETYLLRKWTNKEHPEYAGAAPTATQVVYDRKPAALAAAEGVTVQATDFPVDEAIPTFLTNATAFIHLDASDVSMMEYAAGTGNVMSVSKVADPRGNGKYGYPSFNNKPKLRMNYQNGRAVLDMGQKGDAGTTSTDAADLRFNAPTLGGTTVILVYANQPNSDEYANVMGIDQWWGASDYWETGGATSYFSSNANGWAQKAKIYIDGAYKGLGVAEGTQASAGFHVVAWNNGYEQGCYGRRMGGVASYNDGSTKCGGMLLGEVWVFESSLTEQQIADASAYLMKKWGIGGQSFAAPSFDSLSAAKNGEVKLGMAVTAAALSGAGTIAAPSVSGVATISAKLLAESVEGPTVDGTLSIADVGTVNLSLGEGVRRAKPGTYPLVSGATLAADTAAKLANWTLQTPAMPNRIFALRVVDGQICVEVSSLGMAIIVK